MKIRLFESYIDSDYDITINEKTKYLPEVSRVECKEDVLALLNKLFNLGYRDTEYCYVLGFTNDMFKGLYEVSHGTKDTSVVSVRDIFQKLLHMDANRFILVHNHPGGSMSASREDIALVRRLKQAGQIMDVKMMDALIVHMNEVVSYLDVVGGDE